jgi:peptidyl-prolyl cis-trans isomerase A (cyclophilin A)
MKCRRGQRDDPGEMTIPDGHEFIYSVGMRKPAVISLVVVALAGAPTTFTQNQVTSQTSEGVPVRLETALGNIDMDIDTVHAPRTATNFLRYVDGGFYDDGGFKRVTRPDTYTPAPPNRPAMEISQGGINPARQADQFPPIELERTSVTGLKHVRGTVSMARGGPDSATAEFFIVLDEAAVVDFGGKRFDDEQGAAAPAASPAWTSSGRSAAESRSRRRGANFVTPVAITKVPSNSASL